MNVSSFLAIAAVISSLYGLGFLFAPEAVLGMYGLKPTEGAFVNICRLLGAAQLGFGVTAWMARPAPISVLQPVLAGMSVGMVTGLCASLYRQFNGGTPMGWLNVVLYGLLAAGALYFLTRRETSRMQMA